MQTSTFEKKKKIITYKACLRAMPDTIDIVSKATHDGDAIT